MTPFTPSLGSGCVKLCVAASGVAEDGGLLLPAFIPEISQETQRDWSQLSFPELLERILQLFIDTREEDSSENRLSTALPRLVRTAFANLDSEALEVKAFRFSRQHYSSLAEGGPSSQQDEAPASWASSKLDSVQPTTRPKGSPRLLLSKQSSTILPQDDLERKSFAGLSRIRPQRSSTAPEDPLVKHGRTLHPRGSVLASFMGAPFQRLTAQYSTLDTNEVFLLGVKDGISYRLLDIALKLTAQLLHFLQQRPLENFHMILLCPTTGDIGVAAAEALKALPFVELVLAFSKDTKQHRRKQLAALQGTNIFCVEIDGQFSECQAVVQGALQSRRLKHLFELRDSLLRRQARKPRKEAAESSGGDKRQAEDVKAPSSPFWGFNGNWMGYGGHLERGNPRRLRGRAKSRHIRNDSPDGLLQQGEELRLEQASAPFVTLASSVPHPPHHQHHREHLSQQQHKPYRLCAIAPVNCVRVCTQIAFWWFSAFKLRACRMGAPNPAKSAIRAKSASSFSPPRDASVGHVRSETLGYYRSSSIPVEGSAASDSVTSSTETGMDSSSALPPPYVAVPSGSFSLLFSAFFAMAMGAPLGELVPSVSATSVLRELMKGPSADQECEDVVESVESNPSSVYSQEEQEEARSAAGGEPDTQRSPRALGTNPQYRLRGLLSSLSFGRGQSKKKKRGEAAVADDSRAEGESQQGGTKKTPKISSLLKGGASPSNFLRETSRYHPYSSVPDNRLPTDASALPTRKFVGAVDASVATWGTDISSEGQLEDSLDVTGLLKEGGERTVDISRLVSRRSSEEVPEFAFLGPITELVLPEMGVHLDTEEEEEEESPCCHYTSIAAEDGDCGRIQCATLRKANTDTAECCVPKGASYLQAWKGGTATALHVVFRVGRCGGPSPPSSLRLQLASRQAARRCLPSPIGGGCGVVLSGGRSRFLSSSPSRIADSPPCASYHERRPVEARRSTATEGFSWRDGTAPPAEQATLERRPAQGEPGGLSRSSPPFFWRRRRRRSLCPDGKEAPLEGPPEAPPSAAFSQHGSRDVAAAVEALKALGHSAPRHALEAPPGGPHRGPLRELNVLLTQALTSATSPHVLYNNLWRFWPLITPANAAAALHRLAWLLQQGEACQLPHVPPGLASCLHPEGLSPRSSPGYGPLGPSGPSASSVEGALESPALMALLRRRLVEVLQEPPCLAALAQAKNPQKSLNRQPPHGGLSAKHQALRARHICTVLWASAKIVQERAPEGPPLPMGDNDAAVLLSALLRKWHPQNMQQQTRPLAQQPSDSLVGASRKRTAPKDLAGEGPPESAPRWHFLPADIQMLSEVLLRLPVAPSAFERGGGKGGCTSALDTPKTAHLNWETLQAFVTLALDVLPSWGPQDAAQLLGASRLLHHKLTHGKEAIHRGQPGGPLSRVHGFAAPHGETPRGDSPQLFHGRLLQDAPQPSAQTSPEEVLQGSLLGGLQAPSEDLRAHAECSLWRLHRWADQRLAAAATAFFAEDKTHSAAARVQPLHTSEAIAASAATDSLGAPWATPNIDNTPLSAFVGVASALATVGALRGPTAAALGAALCSRSLRLLSGAPGGHHLPGFSTDGGPLPAKRLDLSLALTAFLSTVAHQQPEQRQWGLLVECSHVLWQLLDAPCRVPFQEIPLPHGGPSFPFAAQRQLLGALERCRISVPPLLQQLDMATAKQLEAVMLQQRRVPELEQQQYTWETPLPPKEEAALRVTPPLRGSHISEAWKVLEFAVTAFSRLGEACPHLVAVCSHCLPHVVSPLFPLGPSCAALLAWGLALQLPLSPAPWGPGGPPSSMWGPLLKTLFLLLRGLPAELPLLEAAQARQGALTLEAVAAALHHRRFWGPSLGTLREPSEGPWAFLGSATERSSLGFEEALEAAVSTSLEALHSKLLAWQATLEREAPRHASPHLPPGAQEADEHSALQREVLTALETLAPLLGLRVSLQQEHCFGGSRFLAADGGNSSARLLLEVDGPTHFVTVVWPAANAETAREREGRGQGGVAGRPAPCGLSPFLTERLDGSSVFKSFVFQNLGWRLVRLSYRQWRGAHNKEALLRGLLVPTGRT
ncbi:l-threonine synthase [Cyclospora cayetanensis]|uniref:L-threonine synthase n=1 Tax=Cyclospora cayetanensis TaxID=88456 RepID=A0A1D3D312_9EIME|nr:l-threonine synthase [Cyclospora cayetanensis]